MKLRALALVAASLLTPVLIFVEHGELFFDLGMDRAGGLVSGFGIHLGFGL